MKHVFQAIGIAYVLATVLGTLGFIDMHVCVGVPGSCTPSIPAPVMTGGVTA